MGPKRDKDAAMRSVIALVLLLLAGCGDGQSWHMTNVTGGPPRLQFRLTDADGARVTGESYRGMVVALYFGYAQCPDVCPTTLSNLAEVARRVNNPDFRILFVTVDPVKDTPPVLREYAKAFSPQMTGLYGDANALADVARRYRVAYSVRYKPWYEVMHTNAVFFFDRSGRARLVTLDSSRPAQMAEDVKRLLQN
jgi:protein SCO1/2